MTHLKHLSRIWVVKSFKDFTTQVKEAFGLPYPEGYIGSHPENMQETLLYIQEQATLANMAKVWKERNTTGEK